MQRQRVRCRFRVSGIVQGVGFRPFVYSTATRLGLGGFVLNDTAGVLIEVEGTPAAVDRFRSALSDEHPPLALIESVQEEQLIPAGGTDFAIRTSDQQGPRVAAISPDVATCPACLQEISDPGARRHRYPFTNCTDCGPRFTITKGVPYDRPNTTMVAFEMCPACRCEYDDPFDRRFHAQPIACPRCGPSLRLTDPQGRPLPGDPISEAARLLSQGRILAIKGLGGYHLACDASDEHAVAELRRRKVREEKPLALMAPGLEAVCRLAHTTPAETALIATRRRPIVLLERRDDAPVAPSIAPGNRYIGVMLPYTPLHHLLLREVGRSLVMTSANLTDEPIAFIDDDAYARLGGIADAFLVHDREIHMRCDDSVVRVLDSGEYPIRRSRGYAPEPLLVKPPFDTPVLAAGPELKHTFCLGTGARAILSHHIGDLENYEAMTAFLEGVEHFTRVFDVTPQAIAYDLHPEYLSTKWARDQRDVTLVGVQHHHAHIASCLADNGRADEVIGLALDGTGYGDDGALWGCEVLTADLASYERRAHLRYMPLPGGSAAVKQPWRMAAVYLWSAFGDAAADLDLEFVRRTRSSWAPILHMARTGLNAPATSSAGRLFDAVAALCGVRDRVSYEGQAAAELEQIADPSWESPYPCGVQDGIIDGPGLVAAAAEDLAAGRPAGRVAMGFHAGLARALVTACDQVRAASGLSTVALSGGTWQNLLLLRTTRELLAAQDFEVLIHHRVPANDGGISLGQAAVAATRLRAL